MATTTAMQELNEFPRPTFALVHGACFGGGCGIVCCVDVALATPRAQFGLTEVRVGVAPTPISTHMVHAMGLRHTRRYALTGERFGAEEALRIGLVHELVPEEQAEARLASILEETLPALRAERHRHHQGQLPRRDRPQRLDARQMALLAHESWMPGGGSSLDLIAAAHRRGLPFVLARHETAAVIMAATTAELTGRPGAVLVTRGPGVANAANGMAHASLDRAPVLLLADGFTGAERAFANHQWFDHAAMLAPVTKAAAKAVEPGRRRRRRWPRRCSPPPWPRRAGRCCWNCPAPRPRRSGGAAPPPGRRGRSGAPRPAALGRRRRSSREARAPGADRRAGSRDSGDVRRAPPPARGPRLPRPRDLQGEGRGAGRAPALRRRLHRRRGGGAGARGGGPHPPGRRRPGGVHPPALALRRAGRRHRHRAAHVALPDAGGGAARPARTGPCRARGQARGRSAWTAREIAARRAAWLGRLANGPAGRQSRPLAASGGGARAGLRAAAAGADPRVAVDAGAHMFPATTFWQASRPGDLLISNGLSTMGFALPAGIAAALHDPRPRRAGLHRRWRAADGAGRTGDGRGARGEARGGRVQRRHAFADRHQARRARPARRLARLAAWPTSPARCAPSAASALRAATEEEYAAALDQALAASGPALIDVLVDPGSYPAQIKALRG